MSAVIEKKVPNERMTFRHVAEITEGKEQPAPPSWSGALEEYTLKDNGKGTATTKNSVTSLNHFLLP
jgi:hypothetical protein